MQFLPSCVGRILRLALVSLLFIVSASMPCTAAETIWHIKAVHPEGRLLDVKALDADGQLYDVKAIEIDGNRHIMDIKAIKNGERLPVKVIVSDDKYARVKAIASDGTILDVKASHIQGRET